MRARVVASVLVIFALVGCRVEGNEHPKGEAGAALFTRYCAGCHGSEGGGKFLGGGPANRETQLSRQAIADLVTEGLPGHERMPNFPKMTRGEALSLADHIAVLRMRSSARRTFWMEPPRSKTAPAESD